LRGNYRSNIPIDFTDKRTPNKWSVAVLCPIHRKGNKLACENYRRIALLSIVYKLVSAIAAKKLTDYTEQLLREYQSGLWKNRSTLDHIFNIRPYLAKCYEHNIDLNNILINIKEASDNVCRGQLLQTMREIVIPNKLVNVVKMTLEESKCGVKVQGSLSQYFTIRNGSRPEDPLSIVLVNFWEKHYERLKLTIMVIYTIESINT
jgi:hypothetical protein